ncbi:MAG: hypothetical protein OEN01_15855, partial [Candidatus Krumholzibacteria bacterium]|nr:hypothetical protein [Candidatus Krumholzibacteria bacterium]
MQAPFTYKQGRFDWRGSLIPSSIFLVGVGIFASNAFSLFDFPLDDAWIHRVYSRSFAFGQGFQYNEGVQEAGSTSPLWSIVTSPAHWLEPLGTRAVVVVVKIISVLLGLAAIAAILQLAVRITSSRAAGIVAASLVALEPRFLFGALSGMETPLLLLLWLCAFLAVASRKWWLAAIAIGLTPVTRPEAVVVVTLFTFAMLWVIRREWSLRQIALVIVPWIPVGLWAMFCRYATGHWMP